METIKNIQNAIDFMEDNLCGHISIDEIAAMAYMRDAESFLMCNGYKDDEFIDLALMGMRMGMKICLILSAYSGSIILMPPLVIVSGMDFNIS